MARNLLIFVLLAGAAGATWLLSLPRTPDVAQHRTALPPKPGYYMREAVILGTEPDGAIAYRIFAGLVEQPQHERSLALTDVRVEYETHEKVDWLVTAQRATVPGSGKSLTLYDVRLSRGADAGVSIVIETAQLEFDPDTYVARAASPVKLTSGAATLEASGFSADLRQDRVDLEGGHGTFRR